MSAKLSIIIPCLNESGYIGRLMRALVSQTQRGFEVILVDSSSTDDTVAVARHEALGLPLKVVSLRQRGVSKARNAGAAKAQGDWLLFLDADVLIGPSFVANILTEITARRFDIAGMNFSAEGNLFDRVVFRTYYHYCRLTAGSRHPNFPGFAILIKRRLHQHFKGFNEKLTYSEDTAYAGAAVGAGGKLAFLKAPRLWVSMRRFEQNGRVKMIVSYIVAEFRRFRDGGAVRRDNLSYETGQFHDQKPKR